jgi:adenosylhomocysteine nucleosidase
MDSGVFRYWFSEIERDDRDSLSVVITMTGEPRNVPAAIAVEHLLNHFTVDLLIFIGIAAGPEEKVKVGDVVASERVLDYEHVRSELIMGNIVEKPRPLYLEINSKTKNDLSNFDENIMHSQFNEVINKLPKKDLPYGIELKSFSPSFHRGTSIAGERLFADGKISEFRERVDERIRACDQEDSGFAQACKIRGIDWCVFRGISDYGNPQKRDDWHSLSSISAASAAVTFLKHFYRLPNRIDF